MAEVGPYRAEFGAIHHESHTGFLFTVSPADRAPDVAKAMNDADASADLLFHLKDMTKRFERALVASGNTTPEFAAVATQKARAAIARAEGSAQPQTTKEG